MSFVKKRPAAGKHGCQETFGCYTQPKNDRIQPDLDSSRSPPHGGRGGIGPHATNPRLLDKPASTPPTPPTPPELEMNTPNDEGHRWSRYTAQPDNTALTHNPMAA